MNLDSSCCCTMSYCAEINVVSSAPSSHSPKSMNTWHSCFSGIGNHSHSVVLAGLSPVSMKFSTSNSRRPSVS